MTNGSRSTPTRKVELLAAGAAAVTVVLWASAFVSIRSAGEAYSPGALALGRLLAGVLVLGAIWLVRREGWPPRAAWRGIAVSGVLWFGFYMVALNWGEQQVDAGTAALVVNIGPILIALLGARLLGDPMPPRLLAGMAVSFAGAVAVGLSMSGEGGASVLGVVLCVLAAVGYAAGVVAQKPALGSASPLQVTTFGCLVGAVACLPFAGQLVREAADAPASATLNMVYLGVFPTALAFTTWAYALARTTASRMGATTYAVPALVVLMSWLALGEVPGPLTLAGGALCLAGVAVSRSRTGPRTPGAVPGAEVAAPDVVPEPRPGPPARG
ncbi:DMT family transporter [Streptomyces sp. NBC_00481]|uniref:DMT family transporter n=1 Tax=unclassified Streptomyces TaxID=2593676 RepID=UPI002DDB5F01|nr:MULTISPECIES: DMT family transporter [unclassified Streptomyces]WRY99631.1 DMT family transporter [Streptomyces sp. NBC_00481]